MKTKSKTTQRRKAADDVTQADLIALQIGTTTRLMEDGIQLVLKGQTKSFELPIQRAGESGAVSITPAMVAYYLGSLGWEKGELDTNGWQYDWWIAFTKGDKSFAARGSGYYGGFHFAPTES